MSQIDFQSVKGLASSVCILQEIADEHPGFEPNSILIPGDNDEGLPLHRVFFRDMNFLNLSGGMIDLIPAHNSISRALAESLGIPFLSTLMLDDDSAGGQDNHEEDEQMSEDFVNRIQGFLREYDVRYALNEFLANADDAQASRFKLLLDTPTNVGERFVSPAFQKMAGCSRLVLFNDATFSEADFKGLRHVGLGGKRGLANTHGRHGLGALSFYYFTDVSYVPSSYNWSHKIASIRLSLSSQVNTSCFWILRENTSLRFDMESVLRSSVQFLRLQGIYTIAKCQHTDTHSQMYHFLF